MAVTKMTKLTAICDARQQENLLRILQGLQRIEMRDLKQENASNTWVKDYFDQEALSIVSTRESEFEQVQKNLLQALQFIRHYGAKNKAPSLQRRFLSLQELENNFDEEKLLAELPEILALEKKWQELMNQREELNQAEAWLNHWQYLDINPNLVQQTFTELSLVSVPQTGYDDFVQTLNNAKNIHLEEIYRDEIASNFAVMSPKQQKQLLQQTIEQAGGTTVVYPYELSPKDQLADTKKALVANQKQIADVSQLAGEKLALVPELQWAEEVLLARQQRETVKNHLLRSPYLVIIQGWIAEKDQEILISEINQQLGENQVYLDFEEPNTGEISEEVPTKLENHPLVAPFELLTEMYNLPKYEEIDPTPWMMPFYLVFFGMMVADAGYGLLMLVATTFALKKMVLPTNMIRFAKFFQILSVPTIIWGLIYASFFGVALPYPPILSTTTDVVQILILSVVFGLIQILVGLFIAAKENIKRHDYLSAISDGFAWQGILIGLVLALVGNMLLSNSTIMYLGIGIAVVSAISILIVPMLQSKSKVRGFAKGVYALYGITSYVGDLVSYTRLMALGISGGSIAAAFNLIVGYLPVGARFTVGIVLIVLLQGVNIFLSLLSAFVHGARLQYVEFFGKFYQGGGRGFKPLKTAEKYLNIKRKED